MTTYPFIITKGAHVGRRCRIEARYANGSVAVRCSPDPFPTRAVVGASYLRPVALSARVP